MTFIAQQLSISSGIRRRICNHKKNVIAIYIFYFAWSIATVRFACSSSISRRTVGTWPSRPESLRCTRRTPSPPARTGSVVAALLTTVRFPWRTPSRRSCLISSPWRRARASCRRPNRSLGRSYQLSRRRASHRTVVVASREVERHRNDLGCPGAGRRNRRNAFDPSFSCASVRGIEGTFTDVFASGRFGNFFNAVRVVYYSGLKQTTKRRLERWFHRHPSRGRMELGNRSPSRLRRRLRCQSRIRRQTCAP